MGTVSGHDEQVHVLRDIRNDEALETKDEYKVRRPKVRVLKV